MDCLFSYDVVVAQTPQDLLNKFRSSNAKILFGAEAFCWPDRSLEVNIFSFKSKILKSKFYDLFFLRICIQ